MMRFVSSEVQIINEDFGVGSERVKDTWYLDEKYLLLVATHDSSETKRMTVATFYPQLKEIKENKY